MHRLIATASIYSRIDVDSVSISCCNCNRSVCAESTLRGITNPAYQNPPQNEFIQTPQNPQHPQNPAYLHQPHQNQQSSQHNINYQPGLGYEGAPPNYTAHEDDQNAKLRFDTYAPQEMPAIGQQPSYPGYTFHDPRSFVPACPPPTTAGQYVVSQPQAFGGQPPIIIVQPILENPPQDYMAYSIFVTFCCCWIIGALAISKSIECRRAIAVGNRQLANEKSIAARNTANASVGLGILAYIVVGVVIGIRVALATSSF